ncbi:MAG TPA: SDR family oxidoreductase [Opitutaceae bacterium]|nr:SDR family oxidoreductase [Opitutaceae bacterium]
MRPLALITGASAGIGAVFARRLAQRGHDLILVARREDKLAELARALEAAHGVRCEVLAADLVADEGQARVAGRIAAVPLDLLVNNAGFGSRGYFHQSDLAGQERMHRLHVLATVRLTHAALGGMVARGRGGIINVSSVAGFFATPGGASYSATKAWMNTFTEGIWLELRALGSPVKVQALCPGFTHTEFHDVLGVDRAKVAGPLWLSADFVVDRSLQGLDEGRPYVVTGWIYRLVVAFAKLAPAALVRALNRRRARASGRI